MEILKKAGHFWPKVAKRDETQKSGKSRPEAVVLAPMLILKPKLVYQNVGRPGSAQALLFYSSQVLFYCYAVYLAPMAPNPTGVLTALPDHQLVISLPASFNTASMAEWLRAWDTLAMSMMKL